MRKAFETINSMLHNYGFDNRWIGWINFLLGSGTSAVLNGVPGKIGGGGASVSLLC